MNVVCLCPTFRHPELLANSLALWERQDYPKENRRLVILDDGQTFDNQEGDGWRLVSMPRRMASIVDKYNLLLSLAESFAHPAAGATWSRVDAVLVWEDDDVYLPGYISAHVAALAACKGSGWSKPATVWSDYTQRLELEPADGRFHSTLAMSLGAVKRVGGWPDTQRADFDQQLMNKLREVVGPPVRPWSDVGQHIPFVYSWHTGAAHCQSTMRAPDDETWYQRGEEAYKKVMPVGRLVPHLDERSRRLAGMLEVAL